ncbi:hypothetical protein [Gabonibacter chumensis]|uniref:hypothetical protein n=1 Tax=Gabonibacter chumensis TaxID=2972474 RepID=UPI0025725907|nr:hypothetical protein [Gabonibacter chumensis]MCR9011635.1 hypothetical protein [Gabonibacter chumensis]
MNTIIEKARELAKEKKTEEAVALLEEQVIGEKEGPEEILMELGIIYNGKADFTRALNYFNAVLRLNPDNGKARTYVNMINGILDYYCKDLLNP